MDRDDRQDSDAPELPPKPQHPPPPPPPQYQQPQQQQQQQQQQPQQQQQQQAAPQKSDSEGAWRCASGFVILVAIVCSGALIHHKLNYVAPLEFQIVHEIVRDSCVAIPVDSIAETVADKRFASLIVSLRGHMIELKMPVVCAMDVGDPLCVCLFRTTSGSILEMINANISSVVIDASPVVHQEWSHFCQSEVPAFADRRAVCWGKFYNLDGDLMERRFDGQDSLNFQYLCDVQDGDPPCPRKGGTPKR